MTEFKNPWLASDWSHVDETAVWGGSNGFKPLVESSEIYKSRYAEFRCMLDYSYFPVYPGARQSIQDDIVEKHFEKLTLDKSKPHVARTWLLYTCGAYGSGKSHTLKTLNYLSSNTVLIDPDVIKSLLLLTYESKDSIDDMATAKCLHLESTFVASIVEQICIAKGYDAVIDGSLHDSDWYATYFQLLKKQHPQYGLCIVKVDCDLPTVLKRCKQRAQVTNRVIPDQLLCEIHAKVPTSFQALHKFADCVLEVDNSLLPRLKTIQFHIRDDDPKMRPRIPPFLNLERSEPKK